MKKVLKNRIFLCLIVGICCLGIGVYAANVYQYNASEISYNSSEGKSITVNDALNEIYNIKTLGDATESDIAEGKTAIVQGKLVTGIGSGTIKEYMWVVFYERQFFQYVKQDMDGEFSYLKSNFGNEEWSTTHIYFNKGGGINAKVAGKFYVCSGSNNCEIVTATKDQVLVYLQNEVVVFVSYLS